MQTRLFSGSPSQSLVNNLGRRWAKNLLTSSLLFLGSVVRFPRLIRGGNHWERRGPVALQAPAAGRGGNSLWGKEVFPLLGVNFYLFALFIRFGVNTSAQVSDGGWRNASLCPSSRDPNPRVPLNPSLDGTRGISSPLQLSQPSFALHWSQSG